VAARDPRGHFRPADWALVGLPGRLAESQALVNESNDRQFPVARARGRVGGRPPVMTAEKVKVARQMYDSKEHTVEAIAQTLGVSRKTVYRHLAPTG